MQEKAAHRLLAQTLHQQVVEELHKNPELAADPEQQVETRLYCLGLPLIASDCL